MKTKQSALSVLISIISLFILLACLLIPPVARATDLSYSPAAPQTGDSDLIIAHKTAVDIHTIADGIGAAITNGAGTLLASEAHIGEVGGNAITVSPTVTASTSPAYTAGDVIGGKLTLTSAARVSGGTTILESIFVEEKGSQAAALDILIFGQDPSNGTYTDNGAFSANDTDMGFLIARIHVASTDYVATGGYTTANLGGLGRVLTATGSANLFAVVVTSGTPTYSATTSLKVRFGFKRN